MSHSCRQRGKHAGWRACVANRPEVGPRTCRADAVASAMGRTARRSVQRSLNGASSAAKQMRGVVRSTAVREEGRPHHPAYHECFLDFAADYAYLPRQ